MDALITRFAHNFDSFVAITKWPVCWRRRFVLTFPIALPLWFLVIVAWFIFMLALSLAALPIWLVADLWKE